MTTPEKCIGCEHTIIQLEEVHDGWCKYHIDCVVRCDCFPAHYIVGCSCAEIYCEKTKAESEDKGASDNYGGVLSDASATKVR